MRAVILIVVMLLPFSAWAVEEISLPQSDGNHVKQGGVGDAAKVYQSNLTACEDEDAQRCLVESRYPRVKVTADTLVSGLPGYVESITIAPNDSAPTAGQIVLYDNTAESGTELFRFEVTTAYFLPFTITIHAIAGTGIYAGFTTTNDVNVWINYRVSP